MAGINFADQLKDQTAAGGTSRAAGIFDSAKLDSRSTLRLLALVLGVASIFGAKNWVKNYTDEIAAGKEAEIAQVDTLIQAEHKKLAALKDIAAEADTYNKRLDELKQKIALVDSVSRNRNFLVRMVDFTVSEMPGSLWLNKVQIDAGNAGEGKVEITGYAMSLQLVGEFLKRLEGAVFFPSWNLVETDTAVSSAPGGAADAGPKLGKAIAVLSDSKRFSLNARVVRP